MNITEILPKENILLELDVMDREECLNFLIDNLDKNNYISNKKLYYKSILKREKNGSTAVGFGIAIPHGKSDGVKSPVLSFARIKNPIDWNSLDGSPVSIVFLIGVPEKNSGDEHIKILMTISRKLVHEDFRNKLLNAKSKDEILLTLSES